MRKGHVDNLIPGTSGKEGAGDMRKGVYPPFWLYAAGGD